MAFGAGTALVSFGGANQIIRVEDGTRQVAAAESGQAAESTEAAEDTAAAGNTAAEESLQPQLQPMRMWGTITETGEDQFSFNSQTTNGYQGDVVIHIDPEQTLILDCVTGMPAGQDQIVNGNAVTVYLPAVNVSYALRKTYSLLCPKISYPLKRPCTLRSYAPFCLAQSLRSNISQTTLFPCSTTVGEVSPNDESKPRMKKSSQ